jgi:hypothetical protein
MAYSKARRKFKHTAFIELNQVAVVQTMYEDGDYQTFKDFRILACDGSKIRLPEDDPEVAETFGTRSYANGQPGVAGVHPMALASVFYDVLNRVALDAQLLPVATHEVSAAISQIQGTDDRFLVDQLTKDDLIVQDRGYHSYRMLAALSQTRAPFVVRGKRGSGMRIVDDMLNSTGSDDRVAAIRQDFFVTVFLGGVESIFIEDAEDTLAKQTGGHPKKVNKAVSFNAIKDRAWELFTSKDSQDQVIEELEALFLTNPTLIRKDRNPPRKRHPDNKVLDFYKRRRKVVY